MGEHRRGRRQSPMASRFPFLLAFLAVTATAASGQTTPTRLRSGGGSISGTGTYSATANLGPAPAVLPPAITGAPYSGEEVTESSQTLTDGTRLTRKIPQQRVYRDGLGRTRVECPILQPPPGALLRRPAVEVDPIVSITDPVAGVQYVLDMQHRVAYRSSVRTSPPVEGGGISASLGRSPARLPQGAESLGTQTIDGVLVEGVRTTQTIPAGMQGYDRAIVIAMETWTSPELRITMLRKTTDPRSGESTFRIESFSRTEPDATLFLPPPDYEIKEEAGPLSITYSKP
jgi:hypothetical protein